MLCFIVADRLGLHMPAAPQQVAASSPLPTHKSVLATVGADTLIIEGKLPRPRYIASAPPTATTAAATEEPVVGVGEPALPPQRVMPDPATVDTQAQAVALRLQNRVPRELAPYFNVFLYVSKAADGAWAQRMFIFHKEADGTLVFERSFFVSTGRERSEKYFTTTPAGFFELDPNRFDRVHYSHRWNGAAMPWAMFFNYQVRYQMAGLALHSAGGHEYELGRRASGGCVRLPHDMAQMLFERFKAEEAGRVPVLATDNGFTNREGRIARDANGLPLMTSGYRVLLFIEDYPGEPALVAVIS